MTALNKILLTLYYIIWTVFLVSAYSILTEKFYQVGFFSARIFGALTILTTLLTLLVMTLIYYLRKDKRVINRKLIKLIVIPVFGLIPFLIINAMPRQLEDETKTIKVVHYTYGCECADWNIGGEDIFIEPINFKVILPDTIGYNGDVVELTGKFYIRKGFPKGYFSSQYPDKARVFRYDKFKVILSNHYESVDSLEK